MLVKEKDGDLDNGFKLYFSICMSFPDAIFCVLKCKLYIFNIYAHILTYIFNIYIFNIYALVLMYFCTTLLLP